ncbi:MAG: Uma2 family endonuclease [Betaproteobacteria bacterium]|nr:Uma2 family endonuclease [Burkholderiales bacterium]MBA3775258.1 Uma2 family endonuclease [Betaproteobacteria bacterium]MDQ3195633.1 Uma2 family endonuclease [Pseudomonadota bacterium]
MGEPLTFQQGLAVTGKHPLTVMDFARMAEVGILREDDRVELIEGELIDMAPIGPGHIGAIALLTKMMVVAAADKAVVSVQSSILLSDRSQPQPDLVLLKARADYYRHALPAPADILLLIEVADTSIEYDRDIKLPLYGKSGVPEVWLVNLKDEAIEIHQEPGMKGYQRILRPDGDKVISPLLFSDFSLSVKQLFSPSAA